MASRLRLLAQASGAEEDLLIIDAALAAAGCPRPTAPPLAHKVARGCLRVLILQRAHGIIARDRGNEHADRIARSWGKLQLRCTRSIGPTHNEQKLPDRERRLVELTAQLIDSGRTAAERVDPPPQTLWEQLAREAYLGFQSEFGKDFETSLQWVWQEHTMEEISAVGHAFHRTKGTSCDSWDKLFLQQRPVSEITETISVDKLNRLRGARNHNWLVHISGSGGFCPRSCALPTICPNASAMWDRKASPNRSPSMACSLTAPNPCPNSAAR